MFVGCDGLTAITMESAESSALGLGEYIMMLMGGYCKLLASCGCGCRQWQGCVPLAFK